ncbi:hypothetical protein, partial [Duffyella gerundensis]|uniref:hypothetical protein n=3 Tax=Duffyella gerundensis TaxID=1619313 RepID=UPI001CA42A71
EPTKVPACGGRLCLPDSRGAGAGRMPPLLGRPEGQNEMAVDLAVEMAFKRAAFRQNEMALDLKDVDLKDADLKDADPKRQPARHNQ